MKLKRQTYFSRVLLRMVVGISFSAWCDVPGWHRIHWLQIGQGNQVSKTSKKMFKDSQGRLPVRKYRRTQLTFPQVPQWTRSPQWSESLLLEWMHCSTFLLDPSGPGKQRIASEIGSIVILKIHNRSLYCQKKWNKWKNSMPICNMLTLMKCFVPPDTYLLKSTVCQQTPCNQSSVAL